MVDFSISVTAAEQRRLSEFLDALRTPCEVWMNPKSIWRSDEFETEFRSKLLAHHCFMGSPLFQEGFDSSFMAACAHAGHQAEAAPPGQRFWDLMVDGRRISLETASVDASGWHDTGKGPGSAEGRHINWLTITDNAASVVEDVKRIKAHPLVPDDVPVCEYIYDCKSGRLVEVPEATVAGRTD